MTLGPSAVSMSPTKSTPRYGAPARAMPANVGSTISRMTRARMAASIDATGVKAPMPPVFGPRSPSKTVLWSCAALNATQAAPFDSAKNETSSPRKNSSTTTVAPAAPNSRCSMQRAIATSASASVAHTMAPLPAASPSALTTTGAPDSRQNARARAGSEHREALVAQAVGETGDQRHLRPHDDEVGALALGEPHDAVVVVDAHRHARRVPRHAGIARRRHQTRQPGTLGELPAERVLAAAAADDENVHSLVSPGRSTTSRWARAIFAHGLPASSSR